MIQNTESWLRITWYTDSDDRKSRFIAMIDGGQLTRLWTEDVTRIRNYRRHMRPRNRRTQPDDDRCWEKKLTREFHLKEWEWGDERAIGAPKSKTASTAYDDGALRRMNDGDPRPCRVAAMTSCTWKRWLGASAWNGGRWRTVTTSNFGAPNYRLGRVQAEYSVCPCATLARATQTTLRGCRKKWRGTGKKTHGGRHGRTDFATQRWRFAYENYWPAFVRSGCGTGDGELK